MHAEHSKANIKTGKQASLSYLILKNLIRKSIQLTRIHHLCTPPRSLLHRHSVFSCTPTRSRLASGLDALPKHARRHWKLPEKLHTWCGSGYSACNKSHSESLARSSVLVHLAASKRAGWQEEGPRTRQCGCCRPAVRWTSSAMVPRETQAWPSHRPPPPSHPCDAPPALSRSRPRLCHPVPRLPSAAITNARAVKGFERKRC